MQTLEEIIEQSKNLDKNEEKQILLKMCEPISLALYKVNKQAKVERDIMKKYIHEDKEKHCKIDCALSFFKIKESRLHDNDTLKVFRYEFDKKDLEKMRGVLVDEALKKCQHPYQRIVTFNAFYENGLLTEMTDYIKENLDFLKKYYKVRDVNFKDHVDKLPEINEAEFRKYINNCFDYIEVFKPSEEIEIHKKIKDEYYNLKETFLGQLEFLGLKADEIHSFGKSYEKVWKEMLYVNYGGFGYHVNEDFAKIEDNLKKSLITDEIASESNKSNIDFVSAKKSLEDTIKVLEAYEKNEISFNDTCSLIEKVIEKNPFLKERKQELSNENISK